MFGCGSKNKYINQSNLFYYNLPLPVVLVSHINMYPSRDPETIKSNTKHIILDLLYIHYLDYCYEYLMI